MIKNDQNDQNDQKVTIRVIQNMTMTKTVKTRKNPKKRGFKKWSKTVFSKLKKPKKSGPKPKKFDRAGTRFLKSKKKFSPVLKSFSKTQATPLSGTPKNYRKKRKKPKKSG